MELKDLLGEAYKDGMTIDEINAAIAEKDLVDKNVLESYAPKDELSKLKAIADKNAKEASDWKHKYNDTLSEQEKLEQARNEELTTLKESLNTLQRDKQVTDYMSNLVAQGYSKELAKETAEAMLDGKMDIVFANQSKFLEEIKSNAIKEKLNNTHKPNGGGVDKGMTHADFLKMTIDERISLKNEKPEIYEAIK